MRKTYKVSRTDYVVLKKIVKPKHLPKQLKKLVKIATKCIQDYTGFKKKFKIIFSREDSELYGEFLGIVKNKGWMVIYLTKIESETNCDEHLIRTVIHEYLHYYFAKKRLNRVFSLETEEELIERIEADVWREYFI